MPQTSFQALLAGLRLPLLVAPMFLVSGPALVIAARRAGALAALPATNARSVTQLDQWMAEIDAAVGHAWGQNLITHRSYPRLAQELELVAQYQPQLVISALGGPRPLVATVESYGGTLLADVISADFARKALDQGAHGLALVCSGAGGHTGDRSVFSFMDEVRSFFDGPLVVGGGLSSGQAIRALEVYGADLVNMGTHFIAAEESLAQPGYKQMLVDCNFNDLLVTRAFTGARASMLLPSIRAAGIDPDALDESKQPDFANPDDGKAWRDIWSAGQGLNNATLVAPTAELVAQLEQQYRQALAREAQLRRYGTGE